MYDINLFQIFMETFAKHLWKMLFVKYLANI